MTETPYEPDPEGRLVEDADGFAAVYVLWSGSDHANLEHSSIGGPFFQAEVCSCMALVIRGHMNEHLAKVKHA